MPTYDYVCQACGHEFEKFQPITQTAVRQCPKCKKRKVRRRIGAGAGVLFKGSGFYQTDYRSDSYRKGAEKDKPSGDSTQPAGGAGKSSGSSSKPAGDGGSSSPKGAE